MVGGKLSSTLRTLLSSNHPFPPSASAFWASASLSQVVVFNKAIPVDQAIIDVIRSRLKDIIINFT
jgi:hypothetical protein